MQRFTYILFYIFSLLLMLIPTFLRHKLSNLFALLFFYLVKRYRYIVHANLEHVFPNKYTQKEKDTIAKQCFKNLLQEVLSVIEFHFTSKKKLQKMIRVEGEESLRPFREKGQGIVFFTNHYNNLEVAGIGLAKVAQTLHVVQEASNPYLNAFIARSREKNGLHTIPMNKAVRQLAKQLKNGKDVSLVVDQSVNEDAGTIVRIFGKESMHLTSASFLSRKFDAPLIPTQLIKDTKGKWVYKIYPPISFTKTDDVEKDILYLTQAQAHFLEQNLKEDPTPWFWCHRRWKKTHPEIYKRDK